MMLLLTSTPQFLKVRWVYLYYRGYSEASVNRHSAAVLPSLAWLSAGLKIKTNSMHSHVIFIAFFKLQIENVDGDDFNQFLMDIPSFWCIICLCSWIRSYLPPKKYWWDAITVHSDCWPLIPYLYYPCYIHITFWNSVSIFVFTKIV